MTVNDLLTVNGFSAVVLSQPEREIQGVYIGDLLSWVMSKAQSGDAWITIMSNINTVAVATLTDCACIILAEGVTLDEDIKKTAREKGINVLCASLSAYDAAIELSRLLV